MGCLSTLTFDPCSALQFGEFVWGAVFESLLVLTLDNTSTQYRHVCMHVSVCVCLTNGLTLSLGAGHDVDRMSAIGSRSTKLLNYALCIKSGGRGEERG